MPAILLSAGIAGSRAIQPPPGTGWQSISDRAGTDGTLDQAAMTDHFVRLASGRALVDVRHLAPAPTTTTLTTSPAPPVRQGTAVTLTVTSTLAAGSHQLTALFTPADPAAFGPSTSATMALTVSP